MNGYGKWMRTAALALVVLLAGVGQAQASDWYPSNITTLTNYLTNAGASFEAYSGSALTGQYDLTPLAYEAADKIQLRDSYEAGNVLFTNTKVSKQTGKWKTADMGTAIFYDTTYRKDFDSGITSITDAKRVQVLALTDDWVVSNKLTLSAGTLILGLNDPRGSDTDFDDFVLAAKAKSAPTPVPGAVWLLGSGLLALMGYKHTRKNSA